MRRREFIAWLSSAVSWPVVARAQQTMPLVGWLGIGASLDDTARDPIAGIKQGLAETGFVEGRNFAFEYRFADNHLERFPVLAAELVGRQVAVIFAGTTAAALAAKDATKTIPIVFVVGIDPVAFGLIASFNQPGGNITGVSNAGNLLAAKRLELLRELVPAANLFGVLANPNSPNAAFETKEVSKNTYKSMR